MKKRYLLIALLSSFFFQSQAQPVKTSDQLQPVNRNVQSGKDKNRRTIVHLDARPGAGIAWIKGTRFATGIIEADIKGKNVLQESFVGIAFHGVNDTIYEAVYLRPFNFKAKDKQRQQHSVQYIVLPGFDWAYLREKFPGRYESGLLTATDPDAWVHLKIVVTKDTFRVFINEDAQPCLTIKRLAHHHSGKIGYWVGNGSDGDFANLKIQNK
ncbi:hypothetical protein A8C56_00380 [Niabella ginsenosidivorans]|uniref:3-keto-disaccharide hydrolase domain-containing protein n=1 Tax=Niabella ginsenosidivorans TaxID=1176587 RepID=A0A1A9HWM0_9BACT|nr:hypothetical protein [Niabella ginsenosidivorans]ANH79633.1 hypothetical protein A8C56_00380 [Niabella ginsenosidivorans]